MTRRISVLGSLLLVGACASPDVDSVARVEGAGSGSRTAPPPTSADAATTVEPVLTADPVARAPDSADSLAATLATILPEQGTTLVVDHVRLTGSPMVGSLGAHLDDLLAEAAASLPGVTLVSADGRDTVLGLLAQYVGDLYDPESVPDLGNFQAGRTLLRGTFVELDDGVRLALEAVDIGSLAARRASVTLARGDLPVGLSSRPSNAELLEGTLAAWRAEIPEPPFVVETWTDHGQAGAFVVGDTMHLFVRSERAGTLQVEILDATGSVTRLPLGTLGEGVPLAARRVREIPDESTRFELLVSEGHGAEVFRTIVTTHDGTRSQAIGSYIVDASASAAAASPTTIAFDPLPPVLGTTSAELLAWTALLRELYVEHGGAVARRRKALMAEVAALDPISTIPARLNAVRGVDLADPNGVKSVYHLVADWITSVAYTPMMYFDGDVSRMSEIDVTKRLMAIANWESWWRETRGAGQDRALLDDYRARVDAKRAARDEEDGR